MTKRNYKEIKEQLRQWLVDSTQGCDIQNKWPCETCTLELLRQIGLNPRKKEYEERNKPIDRLNEVWRAILQIRDAK